MEIIKDNHVRLSNPTLPCSLRVPSAPQSYQTGPDDNHIQHFRECRESYAKTVKPLEISDGKAALQME